MKYLVFLGVLLATLSKASILPYPTDFDQLKDLSKLELMNPNKKSYILEAFAFHSDQWGTVSSICKLKENYAFEQNIEVVLVVDKDGSIEFATSNRSMLGSVHCMIRELSKFKYPKHNYFRFFIHFGVVETATIPDLYQSPLVGHWVQKDFPSILKVDAFGRILGCLVGGKQPMLMVGKVDSEDLMSWSPYAYVYIHDQIVKFKGLDYLKERYKISDGNLIINRAGKEAVYLKKDDLKPTKCWMSW